MHDKILIYKKHKKQQQQQQQQQRETLELEMKLSFVQRLASNRLTTKSDVNKYWRSASDVHGRVGSSSAVPVINMLRLPGRGVNRSFSQNISLITQPNPMLPVRKRIVSPRRETILLSTHNIGFE